jgi:hypothetical protein
MEQNDEVLWFKENKGHSFFGEEEHQEELTYSTALEQMFSKEGTERTGRHSTWKSASCREL